MLKTVTVTAAALALTGGAFLTAPAVAAADSPRTDLAAAIDATDEAWATGGSHTTTAHITYPTEPAVVDYTSITAHVVTDAGRSAYTGDTTTVDGRTYDYVLAYGPLYAGPGQMTTSINTATPGNLRSANRRTRQALRDAGLGAATTMTGNLDMFVRWPNASEAHWTARGIKADKHDYFTPTPAEEASTLLAYTSGDITVDDTNNHTIYGGVADLGAATPWTVTVTSDGLITEIVIQVDDIDYSETSRTIVTSYGPDTPMPDKPAAIPAYKVQKALKPVFRASARSATTLAAESIWAGFADRKPITQQSIRQAARDYIDMYGGSEDIRRFNIPGGVCVETRNTTWGAYAYRIVAKKNGTARLKYIGDQGCRIR